MGLDQYIYRFPNGMPPRIERIEGDSPEDFIARRDYLDDLYPAEKLAYFRKFNALHAWVQDYCNNGQEHNVQHIPLDLERIYGLLLICRRILVDPSCAKEVLPPRSGFFFGDTDIDELYMSKVKDLEAVLSEILDHEEAQDRTGNQRLAQYTYWSWW